MYWHINKEWTRCKYYITLVTNLRLLKQHIKELFWKSFFKQIGCYAYARNRTLNIAITGGVSETLDQSGASKSFPFAKTVLKESTDIVVWHRKEPACLEQDSNPQPAWLELSPFTLSRNTGGIKQLTITSAWGGFPVRSARHSFSNISKLFTYQYSHQYWQFNQGFHISGWLTERVWGSHIRQSENIAAILGVG